MHINTLARREPLQARRCYFACRVSSRFLILIVQKMHIMIVSQQHARCPMLLPAPCEVSCHTMNKRASASTVLLCRHCGAASVLARNPLEDSICFGTLCWRDGATSPVVNLAALLWWQKYGPGGMSAFMVAEVQERGPHCWTHIHTATCIHTCIHPCMHAYMHVGLRSHFSQHLQFIGDLRCSSLPWQKGRGVGKRI